MHWPCTLCAVTDPSVGETAALCKLIEDLQVTGTSNKRDMAALVAGLWSGRTTLSDTASSVGSILDAVSMPPMLAPGHMASGQPGRGGGR